MKRGDIYLATLDPTMGSEIKKTRPVIIISSDINNRNSDVITIIPITSSVSRVFPFEVRLNVRNKTGKAQCNQIRAISKQRIAGEKISSLTNLEIKLIEQALKLHLSLDK